MNQQPTRRAAYLPVGPKTTKHSPLHRLHQIHIVKHHQRGFPAQFQGDLLDVLAAFAHDGAAGGNAAGEGDLVDVWVSTERSSYFGAVAGEL